MSDPTHPSALSALLDGDDDDVVAILQEREVTRRDLARIADELAAALGDVAGRAVGVCMGNVPETIAAWFGIWEAGGAFVPLNPRVPSAEIDRAIARTGCVAVVRGDGDRWDVERVDGDDPPSLDAGDAIVQFTSGTTGQPKAVVLRHDTVRDLLDSVISSLRGGRSGRARMPNIVPIPLSLWGGIYQVLFAFRLGVPVVLMPSFSTREFVRLVREHGIRSSVLPPAALVMLCNDREIDSLEPLTHIRSVSAPLSPVQAQKFHDRFGIAVLNGYGQTELGGEAIGWTSEDWKRFGVTKLGSVGRPHAAFEARIGGGEEHGELEIRSTSPFATGDETIVERITPDGWLRTGDLAHIDADGFVWIEGRVSDMINRGGLKVFPDEVEEVLRHVPGVVDVAVVGEADDRLGEVPVAYVVAAAEVTDDALADFCRSALGAYKVPVAFRRIAELPRNDAGKVLRRELKA